MVNQSILTAFQRMWQHITTALSNKSDLNHNHDTVYETKTDADAKLNQAKEYTNDIKDDLLSDVVAIVEDIEKNIEDAYVCVNKNQHLTEEQKSQARANIGVEETIMDMLITLNLAPVISDDSGAILAESDGTVLLNL